MAFTTTIATASELQEQFDQRGRDHYSHDAYQVLIDLSEECDGIELDVIGICCEWAESDAAQIASDYSNLLDISDVEEDDLFEHVLAFLNENTIAYATGNGEAIFYQAF